MLKKTKNKEFEWTSGINTKSPMSYEKYLKAGLELFDSKKLVIKEYKLANKEEYPFFERGKDIRVVIFWNGDPAVDVNGREYEFIIEINFWRPLNKSKEDREYMRGHANIHLKSIHDAVQIGKRTALKNKATKKPTKRISTKVGHTQQKFEDIKKKK